MKHRDRFAHVPPSGSPSTSTRRRLPHWLRRTSLALLATLALAPASFATIPTAPEIAVEQPPGTRADGTVVAWGQNNFGQTTVPAGLTGVQALAAGWRHTAALKSDGTVVAWGQNNFGQTTVPAGLTGVQAIAAGVSHTVALKSDGTVVAWGSNAQGQTTVPAGLTGVQAIAAGAAHTVALKSDGTIVAWGDNFDGQTTVPVGLTGVQAISAGVFHTVALKSDGTVVAWGRPDDRQTAVPVGLAGVQAIAAGGYHTVALKSDGTVVLWGGQRQTPVPVGLAGVQAIAAGADHTVALKSDGTIVAWGYNADGQTTVPAGLTSVVAIAAGAYHTLALANPVVSFGNQQTSTASAAKTFTIKNTGTADLTISQFGLGGADYPHFTLDAPATPTTVAPGATTTFTVTFNPGSTGAKSVILRVVSDDADEGTYDIPLTGTGTSAPVLTAFTTARKAINIDVLGSPTTRLAGAPAITLLTQPAHGRATVVDGKVRFSPSVVLPADGDSFTYQTDTDGDLVTGTVQIVNFSELAGDYDGLIADGHASGAEAHERGGYLRLNVTRVGTFSGTLAFAGDPSRAAVRENFQSDGGAASLAIRRRPQPAITLDLRYNGPTHTITGTASSTDAGGHTFTSSFTLARQTAAGERAGTYTLLIAPETTVASPQGSGFATVVIDRAGDVRVRGKLADGSAFDSGSYLHEDGSFALYDTLYDGPIARRGSARGVVEFGSRTASAPPTRVNDADGTLAWFKPARTRDDYFPAGFDLSRDAELCRYVKPARGIRVLDFSAATENGRLVVNHPGLTIDQALTLPATNRPYAAPPNAVGLHLHIDLPSGLFTGHFQHPTTRKRTPFAGAVFQLRTMGAGYFLGAGPTDGCAVALEPAGP